MLYLYYDNIHLLAKPHHSSIEQNGQLQLKLMYHDMIWLFLCFLFWCVRHFVRLSKYRYKSIEQSSKDWLFIKSTDIERYHNFAYIWFVLVKWAIICGIVYSTSTRKKINFVVTTLRRFSHYWVVPDAHLMFSRRFSYYWVVPDAHLMFSRFSWA